jgi:hypothetical protein
MSTPSVPTPSFHRSKTSPNDEEISVDRGQKTDLRKELLKKIDISFEIWLNNDKFAQYSVHHTRM